VHSKQEVVIVIAVASRFCQLWLGQLYCCLTQIQIQFIELVARRLKIKKLNKHYCTVQQNNTIQDKK